MYRCKPTNTDITIRYAAAADSTLLAELGARTFYEAYIADNDPESMALYMAASFNPEKQAEELADPLSVVLIAEIGNEAVGYARLLEGAPAEGINGRHPIEIARIYVDRTWQGHGVGSALMKAALLEAEKRGCDVVWLSVWDQNTHGQTFYRRWGFLESGTQPFHLGNEIQRDLLMRKDINKGKEHP